MPKSASLSLDLVGVNGAPAQEPVDVRLENQHLTHAPFRRGLDGSGTIVLNGLHGPPNGLYSVEVHAPSYRPVRRFFSLAGTANRLDIVPPVDPDKVASVLFPDFTALPPAARQLLTGSSSVFGFEGKAGEGLFTALDDIRRAGMLNIFAKTHRTRFADGATVFSFFQELEELRGDRFFVRVPKALREAPGTA
jgi:hypothetical protein